MSSEEFHFAFGVDADYAKYAGIVMTSIVLQHPGHPVSFHLAVDRLLPEDQARFDDFTRLYRGTKIHIYDTTNVMASLPVPRAADGVPERLNRTVFLRILLPDFLPPAIRRIVYLDADLLCIGSLESLWQTALDGAILAAVPYAPEAAADHCRRLRLRNSRYFNAGVMLIDTAAWRKARLTQRVLELCRTQPKRLLMLEQDALNCLLADEPAAVAALPPACNHMLNAFLPRDAQPAEGDVLLHFANEGKPWYHGAAEPIRSLWQSYVQRSLWYGLPELEPADVKTAFLAGKNAEARGDYQEAAHYLGLAADRLMQYFLEQTGQLPKKE